MRGDMPDALKRELSVVGADFSHIIEMLQSFNPS